jgi:hypothetical protein
MEPLSAVKWMARDAPAPAKGRLLGECVYDGGTANRSGRLYRLLDEDRLAEFIWSIEQAPWEPIDWKRPQYVRVALPPSRRYGRVAEECAIVAVVREKSDGFWGFLREHVCGPMIVLGVSLMFLVPLKWVAEVVGAAFGGAAVAIGASAILALVGGFVIGALVVATAIILRYFSWWPATRRPTMASA